jgi:heme/copper-type cytochrome/quinol oxidase subunit 2
VIWIAGAGSLLLLVFLIAGLVDLFRSRHTMETWQVVVWAVVLILVPVAGLIIYLFWRISRSDMIQDTRNYEGEQSNRRGPTPPVGL